MTTFAEHQAAPNSEADDEAKTGLPGVSSWRAVYVLVMIVFVVWVGSMSVFQRIFS